MAVQDTRIVCDIGSGSCGLAIWRLNPGNIPEIIWSLRVPVDVPHDTELAGRVAACGTALKALIHAAHEFIRGTHSGIGGIMGMDIVYSPNWSYISSLAINISREQPFLITERFLTSLAEREQPQDIAGAERTKTTFEDLRLNGYAISDPIGKAVKQLSGYIHFTYIDSQLHGMSERMLMQAFGHIPTIHHASGEMLGAAYQRLTVTPAAYLGIIFVDEEITGLYTLANRRIESQTTFPSGVRDLHRELTPTAETSSIVLTMTRLHLNQGGDPEWLSDVRSKIEKSVARWKELCNETLAALREHVIVPHHYFIIASEGAAHIADTLNEFTSITYAGNHQEPVEVIQGDAGLVSQKIRGDSRDPILSLYALACVDIAARHE